MRSLKPVKTRQDDLGSERLPYNDLTYINMVLQWITVSSSNLMPNSIDARLIADEDPYPDGFDLGNL